MIFRIIPEFDRTGSEANIIRLSTDKEKTSPIQNLGGSSRTPPPLFKKENHGEGDVGPRAIQNIQ